MAPEQDAKAIGVRIREARIKAGLTQLDIAKYFEITDQAVSQWERGVHAPELERAAALAAVLGVPLGWLTGEKENAELPTVGIAARRIPVVDDADWLSEARVDQPGRGSLFIEAPRLYSPRTYAVSEKEGANEPIISVGAVGVIDPDALLIRADFVAVLTRSKKILIRRLVQIFPNREGDLILVPMIPTFPAFRAVFDLDLKNIAAESNIAGLPQGSALVLGPVVELRQYWRPLGTASTYRSGR